MTDAFQAIWQARIGSVTLVHLGVANEFSCPSSCAPRSDTVLYYATSVRGIAKLFWQLLQEGVTLSCVVDLAGSRGEEGATQNCRLHQGVATCHARPHSPRV
jgi:hypothetical protein